MYGEFTREKKNTFLIIFSSLVLLKDDLHAVSRVHSNIGLGLGLKALDNSPGILLQQTGHGVHGLVIGKVLSQADTRTSMEGEEHEGTDGLDTLRAPTVGVKLLSILAPVLLHAVGNVGGVNDERALGDEVAVGEDIVLETGLDVEGDGRVEAEGLVDDLLEELELLDVLVVGLAVLTDDGENLLADALHHLGVLAQVVTHECQQVGRCVSSSLFHKS